MIRAFHRADGIVRARVAPLKLIASAITIGSGGAAGREGPIALVAAGFGSWYATLTGRTGRDRRLLLLVGAAAGLSAIFRSPIGAALLVIEVLYADMEFEASALLYTTLAAIVAYALNGFVAGWGPLFRIPPIAPLQTPLKYGWYAVLGVAAAPWVRSPHRLLSRPGSVSRDAGAAVPQASDRRTCHGRHRAGLPAGHRGRLRVDATRHRRPARVGAPGSAGRS